jgi:hypothetical protein
MTLAIQPLNSVLQTFPNPFHGSVKGDPWDSKHSEADVSEIHQYVFDKCMSAVDESRKDINSCGVTIHGEPGSGKTHLISRLRKSLIDTSSSPSLMKLSQAFAYIRLNTNASTISRHVRKCVAEDLLRYYGNGPSQFERMVIARLMELEESNGDIKFWWDNFLEEGQGRLDELLIRLQNHESLSARFTHVLKHLVLREHRLDVTAWLRGEPLTDAAYQRLGIAADSIDEDLEQTSRDLLRDFMRLAGKAVPLVLCFDQVEALQTSPDDTDAFFKYGKLISNLADADKNLVLISCLQSSCYDLLLQVVPAADMDRMKSYAALSLQPLDTHQARSLLEARLNTSRMNQEKPAGVDSIWPFNMNLVEEMVGTKGCTPRSLLQQAVTRFDELQQLPIEPSLKRELPQWFEDQWEERIEKAAALNTATASEILSQSIPLLVNLVEPKWKSRAPHHLPLDYILQAPQDEAIVGIKICEQTPTSLASHLKKLVELHPAQTKVHKLVLLRDERTPISPNARRTQEYLKALEKNDAIYFPVAPEMLATLDAMRLLLSDANAGDLACDGETITQKSVLEWLINHLPESLKELADVLTQPGNPMDMTLKHSVQLEQLQEWLSKRRLGLWSEAVASLQLSANDARSLLESVEQRRDLIGVIRGEPTVIFTARSGSSHLTSLVID